jgi:hypothetical protein
MRPFSTIVRFVTVSLLLAACLPAGSGPGGGDVDEPVVYWDLSFLFSLNLRNMDHLQRFYDTSHFAASLQGIVNRERPRLFIRYHREPDDFWWDYMTKSGGWLDGRRVIRVRRAEEVVEHFRNDIKGVVVWDEQVPATSNVASTIAGCEDLVCIRYDTSRNSLFSRLVLSPPKLPIGKSLINQDGSTMFPGDGIIPGANTLSTGSPKCDAYIWAAHHYLKKGKCNPQRMGYYLDGYWLKKWNASAPENHTLTNHDYVISKGGFFFDLNVWDDEPPIDDPGQRPGTDAATLRHILRTAYDRFHGNGMIHIAGFVPWAFKYTNHPGAGGEHGAVETEWKAVEILSCFNGFLDADALAIGSMSNASFFQHYPLEDRYAQNPKPYLSEMQARGYVNARGEVVPKHYVAFYVGDFDSAAWLYRLIPKAWDDPARGMIPLSWAFDPNLCERMPLALVYTRENRAPTDFFIAGNSGAGYLNPGFLTPPRPHSGLPSGLDAWRKHCEKFYRQWDISLTGFILDGNAPGMSDEGLRAYAEFSPDGIVAQKIERQGMFDKMPYLRTAGDLPRTGDEEADIRNAARTIAGRFGESLPQFITFRGILKSPTWYRNVQERVLQRSSGEAVEFVDMHTLLWLVGQHEANLGSKPRAKTRYSGVRAVRSAPDSNQGVRPVYFVDGPFEEMTLAGREAWRVPPHDPPYYLYFEVDDGFYRHSRVRVDVRVTYLDTGLGSFSLQYDSFDNRAPQGGVYKTTKAVQRENTGQWKTTNWRLDDARFGNNQNADCDFRIYTGGDELVVSEVLVEKMPM